VEGSRYIEQEVANKSIDREKLYIRFGGNMGTGWGKVVDKCQRSPKPGIWGGNEKEGFGCSMGKGTL